MEVGMIDTGRRELISGLHWMGRMRVRLPLVNYHIKVGLMRSMVDYLITVGLALSMVNYVIKIGLALSTVNYFIKVGLMVSNLNYFNVIGLALMVAIYITEEGKGKAYVVDKVTGKIMEVEDILHTQEWSRVVRDPSWSFLHCPKTSPQWI